MIELGSGVWIEWASCARSGHRGHLIITWRDPAGGAADCSGSVSICGCGAGGGRAWRLLSADPLTIEPSIQCGTHSSHHGWIRGGRWIPA
jgi:hypothetical protein